MATRVNGSDIDKITLDYVPCVSSRIIINRSPLLDSEQLRSVATVQFLETVHGHPRRTGDELQQSSPHLVRETKHNAPEPLHHYVVGMIIALIQGVHFPVFHVNVLNTAHQQLQFVLVEDLDQP